MGGMTMTVKELSREQLNELKQSYLCDLYEAKGKAPSYGELAWVDVLISDREIFSVYEDVSFTNDDFFVSADLDQ